MMEAKWAEDQWAWDWSRPRFQYTFEGGETRSREGGRCVVLCCFVLIIYNLNHNLL